MVGFLGGARPRFPRILQPTAVFYCGPERANVTNVSTTTVTCVWASCECFPRQIYCQWWVEGCGRLCAPMCPPADSVCKLMDMSKHLKTLSWGPCALRAFKCTAVHLKGARWSLTATQPRKSDGGLNLVSFTAFWETLSLQTAFLADSHLTKGLEKLHVFAISLSRMCGQPGGSRVTLWLRLLLKPLCSCGFTSQWAPRAKLKNDLYYVLYISKFFEWAPLHK